MQYESERIEYKSQMIDDIYKEVIAFANLTAVLSTSASMIKAI